MRTRQRLLGPALGAIAALSSLAASPAGAANFTASEYPATFEAGQFTTHMVKLGSLKLECAAIKFAGELTGPTNELTVFPEYGGCAPFAGEPVTVTFGGCDYGLVANSATEGALNIKCKAGAAVVIDVGKLCTFVIEPQGPLKGLKYKNLGGTGGIEVTTEVEKIAYTRFGSALCGNAFGSATYTGTSIYTFKSAKTSLPIEGDIG